MRAVPLRLGMSRPPPVNSHLTSKITDCQPARPTISLPCSRAQPSRQSACRVSLLARLPTHPRSVASCSRPCSPCRLAIPAIRPTSCLKTRRSMGSSGRRIAGAANKLSLVGLTLSPPRVLPLLAKRLTGRQRPLHLGCVWGATRYGMSTTGIVHNRPGVSSEFRPKMGARGSVLNDISFIPHRFWSHRRSWFSPSPGATLGERQKSLAQSTERNAPTASRSPPSGQSRNRKRSTTPTTTAPTVRRRLLCLATPG